MTTALRIPREILDIEVAELLRATPGYKILGELIEINPHSLGETGKLDYLAALDRQESWICALKQEALVAIAGEVADETGGIFGAVDDEEREDVATALRLSPTAAQNRIDVARVLVGHLPNTISALATGEISAAHATVIAKETATAIRNGLSEDAVFRVEQTALAHAEFHTPGQVATKVKTTIAKLAPEEFEEIVDRARDSRRVSCYPEADGMATVVAILPAEDAQTVMKSIEAYILKRNQEDEVDAEWSMLSADMKRADALTAIASQALGAMADDVRPHRRPITISVAVDLPTLLGLAENPGQLAGYGAIPASVARKLAADGTWQRFVSDPTTGNLLDFGREKYIPPQELVDYLLARDRTCRFPGCRRSGQLADIDHAHSWESGGETNPANLGLLCRRHHRMKTHGGWKLKSNADGSCTWESPVGKQFFVPARPILDAI
ncbi:HNH nuclease [Candidatus Nanopelagicaceae bacterium]